MIQRIAGGNFTFLRTVVERNVSNEVIGYYRYLVRAPSAFRSLLI